MLATSISHRALLRHTLFTSRSTTSLLKAPRSLPQSTASLLSTTTPSFASTMPPKNSNNAAQNGNAGEEQKQTSQGHTLQEPPNTGWKGPIPAQNGGQEEGYLQKPPYCWESKEFQVKYRAKCWCGKLEFEYHGDPIDAKHCHCTQCQRLHGAPFQWAALFHKTSVRLAKHCDPIYLDFFSTQEGHSEHSVPCKISCRNCRSPMADEGRNMVMAYPSSFVFENNHVPDVFAPTAHIFYGERVMNLDDDIPKWAGHKNSSEQLPHAPSEETDRTMGKGKRHKADRD